MLALRPQADTYTRRRPPGAAGPLVGRGHRNFLDEQRVDPPVRVVAGHASEAAVHHDRHAIDGQRGLRHIGRNDYFPRIVTSHGAVLLVRRQLAVQGVANETAQRVRTLDVLDRAADFVGPRHEDQDVAGGLRRDPFAFARGDRPNGIVLEIHGFGQVFDFHRKSAPLGCEHLARREVVFQHRRVECRGHDDDLEIGPGGLLDLEGAGQRDVAVEMALVEFVEHDRADAAQREIERHLPEQDALGHETNTRGL